MLWCCSPFRSPHKTYFENVFCKIFLQVRRQNRPQLGIVENTVLKPDRTNGVRSRTSSVTVEKFSRCCVRKSEKSKKNLHLAGEHYIIYNKPFTEPKLLLNRLLDNSKRLLLSEAINSTAFHVLSEKFFARVINHPKILLMVISVLFLVSDQKKFENFLLKRKSDIEEIRFQ